MAENGNELMKSKYEAAVPVYYYKPTHKDCQWVNIATQIKKNIYAVECTILNIVYIVYLVYPCMCFAVCLGIKKLAIFKEHQHIYELKSN